MLRIHFTESDLARIHLCDEPDPMWEILLSLHLLQDNRPAPRFAEWRAQVGARLGRELRPLLMLAPPRGYSPDFLTPAGATDGLEAGLDALRHTPVANLHNDLGVLSAYQTYTDRFAALGEGERRAVDTLTGQMRQYHQIALEPYWMQIRAKVDATRVSNARTMTRTGIDGLLGGLHPSVRWRRPVLEVHGFAMHREVHLTGRGLRLVPSYFCRQAPIMLRDQSLPPVLVYPIDPAPLRSAPAPRAGDRPLAALIGRTRAAILRATAEEGCTTTELARRLGISPATASHHTTVLRDAGLITTVRTGTSVLHTLHPRGDLLLNQ